MARPVHLPNLDHWAGDPLRWKIRFAKAGVAVPVADANFQAQLRSGMSLVPVDPVLAELEIDLSAAAAGEIVLSLPNGYTPPTEYTAWDLAESAKWNRTLVWGVIVTAGQVTA